MYGSITCPNIKRFCKNQRLLCPNWCSNNGFCTNGVCNCKEGYAGTDCSLTSCVTASYIYNTAETACIDPTTCTGAFYADKFNKVCMPCFSKCATC